MWQDLRYSVRTLGRHRAFAVAGVIVLALGIGVNTAIFSVINAILFRPLPVHAPEELRYVDAVSQRVPYVGGVFPYRYFVSLREHTDIFSDLMLMATLRDKVRIGGQIEAAQGESVSSNYFDLLGVKPFIGRAFVWKDDEAANAPRVAIISFDLWQTRFLADPNILGKPLELSRQYGGGTYAAWRDYTIVGVMPRGFKGISNPWDATQYWVPFLRRAADAAEDDRLLRGPALPAFLRDPLMRSGQPVGRLRKGVSSAQAAAVAIFGQQMQRELDPKNREFGLMLSESRRIRLPFDPRGQIVPGRLFTALMAVSGVLLLIAAANLSGMLLARGIARRGELAVRLALGASRWRLTRQLLAESLLLSAGGGAAGLLFERWLIDVFFAGTPTRFTRWQISVLALDAPIDWRVLSVTAASCIITGLFIGLVSARHAINVDVLSGLADQSASATPVVRTSLRRWIVVPQVCLSLVLLLISGVLARTLIRSELRHPGYDASGVALIDFEAPQQPRPREYTRELAARLRSGKMALVEQLLPRAAAVPGVSSVTVAMTTPMLALPLPSMNSWVAARDSFRPDGRHYWTTIMDVTPDYFRTLAIPILRGRVFTAADRAEAPKVAIVSEDLARWMWPGADPLGEHLARHWPDSSSPPEWLEVVGVVRNVHAPLSDGTWSPTLYVPLEQGNGFDAFTIAARAAGSPSDVFEGLKAAITATRADLIASNPRLMRDAIGELLYPRRAAAAILGLAGAIGLLLASTGLYGLISYSVAQRVREIGVRMALGAERADIVRLIIKEGLKVSAAGMGFGFVLTFIAIRATSRLVVAMPSADVLTFSIVPLLLGAVIVCACYIPALRAAKVEPLAVLRGL